MADLSKRTWSNRFVFVLATAGAAVGLGNLWGFPYLAGENGGAAFIFIYLACVTLIAVPIIIAEIAIGRMGHLSPIGTMDKLTKELKASPVWKAIGFLSLAVPFVGFTFYSVVAGWAINYAIKAGTGELSGLTGATSGALFGGLNADPWTTLFYQALVFVLTAFVVGRGLKKGIEWAVKIMMPALFIMLVGIAVYNLFEADFTGAAAFLFSPDFSAVNTGTVMKALGQAFFSVGVGVGFMITYGAYLPGKANIPKNGSIIVGIDTLVALLAGLAIFPIVFAAGLSPGEGPGLTFITMPVAFTAMPGGQVLATVFFILLFIAAFTSTIGMLEPIVSWMEEKWQNTSRFVLSFAAIVVIGVFGIPPALSGSILADVRPLFFIPGLAENDVFTSYLFFTSTIMLPVNGLLIALFAGWVIKKEVFKKDLGMQNPALFNAWHALLKYAAPVAVLAITISGLLAG